MGFLNREQEAAINSATDPEVIKALIHEAAQQGGVQFIKSFEQPHDAVNTASTNGFARDTDQRRDQNGRFAKSETTSVFEKTEVIGGKSLTFTAESAEKLDQMILNAYQVANALTESSAPSTAARNRRSQEANDVEVMRQTELELKFRRGEIGTQQLLEESGAIEEYMASHGAPIKKIVETVQEAQAQQEARSWSDAVETFLQSPAGASWPGGENNLEMMNLQIRSLGLEGAPDKVAALAQAYQSMKQKGFIFEPPKEIRAANELVDLNEAMANATSQSEIVLAMEQYKAGVAAQGGDANTAFVQTFARDSEKAVYRPNVPSGERRSGGSGLFGR